MMDQITTPPPDAEDLRRAEEHGEDGRSDGDTAFDPRERPDEKVHRDDNP